MEKVMSCKKLIKENVAILISEGDLKQKKLPGMKDNITYW